MKQIKVTNRNPPVLIKEEKQRNIDIFKCRYCGILCGCNLKGEVGMYSYKILRKHEENCPENPGISGKIVTGETN